MYFDLAAGCLAGVLYRVVAICLKVRKTVVVIRRTRDLIYAFLFEFLIGDLSGLGFTLHAHLCNVIGSDREESLKTRSIFSDNPSTC